MYLKRNEALCPVESTNDDINPFESWTAEHVRDVHAAAVERVHRLEAEFARLRRALVTAPPAPLTADDA